MKYLNYALLGCLTIIANSGYSQLTVKDQVDVLRYHVYALKSNVSDIRYFNFTDSVGINPVLNDMDVVIGRLEQAIDLIQIPEDEEENMMTEEGEEEISMEDYFGFGDDYYNMSGNEEDGVLGGYVPYRSKRNISFKIQTGINSWISSGNKGSELIPDLNIGKSWYWEFDLMKRIRIGGTDSKWAFNYGVGYLLNRYKLSDKLILKQSENGPIFEERSQLTSNPRINIGYINVPLSVAVTLSKKVKLEAGGYVGYRVHSVQKQEYKEGREVIKEKRIDRYGLNNWLYGASLGMKVKKINLIFRYNLSPVVSHSDYDLNTWMLGTSLTLF